MLEQRTIELNILDASMFPDRDAIRRFHGSGEYQALLDSMNYGLMAIQSDNIDRDGTHAFANAVLHVLKDFESLSVAAGLDDGEITQADTWDDVDRVLALARIAQMSAIGGAEFDPVTSSTTVLNLAARD